MKAARNKTAIELACKILDNYAGESEDLQKIITALTMATRRTNDRMFFLMGLYIIEILIMMKGLVFYDDYVISAHN